MKRLYIPVHQFRWVCEQAETGLYSSNSESVFRSRRDHWSSCSRGLSTRGRGTYNNYKSPVFIMNDRGTGERYVVPAKAADGSTIRLLLTDRHQESLTVYTDRFRTYEPLEEDDAFSREYVVHGDSECVDRDAHVNTCESHGSLVRFCLLPYWGVSKDKLAPQLRAFQPRREVFRKPGEQPLKSILEAVPLLTNNLRHKNV